MTMSDAQLIATIEANKRYLKLQKKMIMALEERIHPDQRVLLNRLIPHAAALLVKYGRVEVLLDGNAVEDPGSVDPPEGQLDHVFNAIRKALEPWRALVMMSSSEKGEPVQLHVKLTFR